jgi:diguanylate cyclase (GGDEF)-like protein
MPFEIHSHTLHIGVSIGIALFPQDGDDASTLIQRADHAMYAIKATGKNHYQFYSVDMPPLTQTTLAN